MRAMVVDMNDKYAVVVNKEVNTLRLRGKQSIDWAIKLNCRTE